MAYGLSSTCTAHITSISEAQERLQFLIEIGLVSERYEQSPILDAPTAITMLEDACRQLFTSPNTHVKLNDLLTVIEVVIRELEEYNLVQQSYLQTMRHNSPQEAVFISNAQTLFSAEELRALPASPTALTLLKEKFLKFLDHIELVTASTKALLAVIDAKYYDATAQPTTPPLPDSTIMPIFLGQYYQRVRMMQENLRKEGTLLVAPLAPKILAYLLAVKSSSIQTAVEFTNTVERQLNVIDSLIEKYAAALKTKEQSDTQNGPHLFLRDRQLQMVVEAHSWVKHHTGQWRRPNTAQNRLQTSIFPPIKASVKQRPTTAHSRPLAAEASSSLPVLTHQKATSTDIAMVVCDVDERELPSIPAVAKHATLVTI